MGGRVWVGGREGREGRWEGVTCVTMTSLSFSLDAPREVSAADHRLHSREEGLWSEYPGKPSSPLQIGRAGDRTGTTSLAPSQNH